MHYEIYLQNCLNQGLQIWYMSQCVTVRLCHSHAEITYMASSWESRAGGEIF